MVYKKYLINMEFNSQICTTRKQSEKLLALGLKKETADMVWSGLSKEPICQSFNRIKGLASDLDDKVHPAWSLHRLIEMIPDKIAYPTIYDYAPLRINKDSMYYLYRFFSQVWR